MIDEENFNHIYKDYSERLINARISKKYNSHIFELQKEYDSLVADLHRYCILNVPDYENTELYKKADKKMGEFDELIKKKNGKK